ncbi:MAG: VOC family protein [Nocardioidaceae bacterium]
MAIAPDSGSHPGLAFVRVGKAKTQKNRLYIDLRPDHQMTEVQRLLALGARPVDIGQGDASCVVLADPEGNGFCVLADWAD